MGETEKPFSCCGCSLSFVSADHLEVHRKKHDMCLNLDAGIQRHLSGYVDQTPTPTRLIRNCDEVGLFPDLQQVVNPFDEQFRKATERRVSSVSENSVLSSSEDALHTPQVFPEPLTPNTRGVLKSLISHEENQATQVISKGESSSSEGSSQQQLKIIIPLTLNLSGGQSVQSQQIGLNVTLPPNGAKENGNDVQQSAPLVSLATQQSAPLANLATQQSAPLVNLTTQQSAPMVNLAAQQSAPLVNLAAQQSAPMAVSGTTIQKADSSSVGVQPPHVKRRMNEKEERHRRFRERNKAAAIRSRKKRKEWISDIQQKCNELNKTNHSLQQKVNLLTAEVTKLKQQLQLHASCPVTLVKQEKTSLGGMSALASLVNKQTLVSSSNMAPVGTSPTLKPVSTSSPTLASVGSGQQMFLLGNMPVLPATSPTQPQVFVLTQGRPPAPPPIQPKRVAILPKTCASNPSGPPASTVVTAAPTAGSSYKDDNPPPQSFDSKDLFCMVPSPKEYGKSSMGKASVITSTANLQTVIVQGPASKHP